MSLACASGTAWGGGVAAGPLSCAAGRCTCTCSSQSSRFVCTHSRAPPDSCSCLIGGQFRSVVSQVGPCDVCAGPSVFRWLWRLGPVDRVHARIVGRAALEPKRQLVSSSVVCLSALPLQHDHDTLPGAAPSTFYHKARARCTSVLLCGGLPSRDSPLRFLPKQRFYGGSARRELNAGERRESGQAE